MKFSLIILFLINTNFIFGSASSLKSEVDLIMSHIDVEQILKVSSEYFENDVSVHKLIRYLLSENFMSVCRKISIAPEVQDILEWMKENSVDFADELSNVLDNFHKITPSNLRGGRVQKFSMASFENEISELINFEEIEKTIEELLSNGQDLAHLYLILKINRKNLEKIFENDDALAAITKIKKFGVNLDLITQNLYKILKWDS